MAGKQADIKVGVLTDYDDKGIKAAKVGLSSFKDSINEAEGVGGKFAAGWGNIKEQVSAHAGQLALAGGAALVVFGAKAVGAFTETAKAAIDLSTSTGLAVEEASRWLGVADDYKVSGEALATGLGKISKTLNDTKWAKYGIETRDASGEARSANDILLDTLDMLSKVTNKTEQATIGQKLFGKGYQSLTPILGHTRAEYEKMLGSVEKGQVITADEAAKAEKFRLAQDKLSDAIKEVTLSVGQQVAALSPLIDKVATLLGMISGDSLTEEASKWFEDVATAMETIDPPNDEIRYWLELADKGKLSLEQLTDAMKDSKLSTEELAQKQRDQAAATSETDRETRKLFGSMSTLGDEEEAAADAANMFKLVADDALRTAQHDVDVLQQKWDTLTGNLNKEKAWLNLKSQAEDVKQANIDAGDAIRDHGPGSPEAIASVEAARVKAIDLELATSEYAKEVAGLPPEVATRIAAEIGAGDIDKALAELQAGFDTTTFRINAHLDSIVVDGETHAAGSSSGLSNVTVQNGVVHTPKYGGAQAAGGPVQAGVAYTVGEKGQETFVPDTNGTIIPNGGGAGVNIGEVHVHVQSMPSPNELVTLLKKYEARNGTAWRA